MTSLAKKQKIIKMKSGLPIWIDIDRVAKLEEVLASGSGHRFIKLDERTINSAEIEGIYTIEQYDELQKIKQGYRQCIHKKWHARKEECTCQADVWKNLEKIRKDREQAELDKPISEEQYLRNRAKIKEIHDELIAKNILKASPGQRKYQLKRSALIEYKNKHGMEYKVPPEAEIIEDVEADSG